jgi:cytochrome b561
MSAFSTQDRYGTVARLLHWGIAAAILVLLATGLVADDLPKELKASVIPFHKALGMIALGLGVIRVAWWAADRSRPGDEDLQWEKWPAKLTKLALLGFGIALPLTGYFMSAYAGRPIVLFGLIDVPLLVAPNRETAHDFKEFHEMLANGLIGLVGLHLAGALFHHFVRKDGILRRMLPARG